MKKLIYTYAFFVFVLFGASCKQKSPGEIKLYIAGETHKIWNFEDEWMKNGKPKYGFCFYPNGEVIKFEYLDKGRKIQCYHGDVIPNMEWKLIDIETLDFWGINYKIIKSSDDSLILSHPHEKIILTLSDDQLENIKRRY